jgi:hypothetical protein
VIYTSTDGRSWTLAVTRRSAEFNNVAFGNAIFLVTGSDVDLAAMTLPPPFVLRSSDAAAFEMVTEPPGPTGYAVVFGNGTFLISSDFERDPNATTVLATTDGVVFERRTLPEGASAGITFGAGLFAFGAGTDVYVSADANTWMSHDTASKHRLSWMRGYDQALVATSTYDCCFGEVPGSAEYGHATSFDGVTWAVVDDGHDLASLPEFLTDGACVSMDAVTFPGPEGGTMLCSAIGDAVHAAGLQDVRSRASGAGIYVVGGLGGIATSSDLVHWERATLP